jgi:hypothetical protein
MKTLSIDEFFEILDGNWILFYSKRSIWDVKLKPTRVFSKLSLHVFSSILNRSGVCLDFMHSLNKYHATSVVTRSTSAQHGILTVVSLTLNACPPGIFYQSKVISIFGNE